MKETVAIGIIRHLDSDVLAIWIRKGEERTIVKAFDYEELNGTSVDKDLISIERNLTDNDFVIDERYFNYRVTYCLFISTTYNVLHLAWLQRLRNYEFMRESKNRNESEVKHSEVMLDAMEMKLDRIEKETLEQTRMIIEERRKDGKESD